MEKSAPQDHSIADQATDAGSGSNGNTGGVQVDLTDCEEGKHGFTICCPFHKEKTPSLFADDDKGTFKCLGCGVEGKAERIDRTTMLLTPQAKQRFVLSFQIPELRFRLARALTLERKLRAVAASAMEHTSQDVEIKPVGMRVHIQYAQKDGNDPKCDSPPETAFSIGRTFTNALRGVVFESSEQVIQLLITKAWGPIDGISVTVWEVQ